MNNQNAGIVFAISVSEKKGTKKHNIHEAEFMENFGIQGDAHAGNWHRQVSLLSLSSVEKMRKGAKIPINPGDFAENLTIDGLDFTLLKVGVRIKIKEVSLEITQIGKECHSRCHIFETVGDCVMPREGIFGKVIKGGMVKVGDTVLIERVEK
ncbi:MAG: MOSC domain-containing protein [Candidatus Brocadiae bacterium]|nr:MOSC domain-containing protein [Candidatus Brocadiia bacterium]